MGYELKRPMGAVICSTCSLITTLPTQLVQLAPLLQDAAVLPQLVKAVSILHLLPQHQL